MNPAFSTCHFSGSFDCEGGQHNTLRPSGASTSFSHRCGGGSTEKRDRRGIPCKDSPSLSLSGGAVVRGPTLKGKKEEETGYGDFWEECGKPAITNGETEERRESYLVFFSHVGAGEKRGEEESPAGNHPSIHEPMPPISKEERKRSFRSSTLSSTPNTKRDNREEEEEESTI